MDSSLRDVLKKEGIIDATIAVLESEMITSLDIFYSLGDSHFQQILPKLKIGQHVLLLNIWHDVISHSAKHSKGHYSDSVVDSRAQRAGSATSGSSVAFETPLSPQNQSIASSTGGSDKEIQLLSSNSDIKDLVKAYKANAISRFKKGCSPKEESAQPKSAKAMKVLLGGMVYDPKKNKGIRKKFLAEPNPTLVEFEKDATLMAVCKKAIDLYYKECDETVTVDDVKLADSAGNILECSLNQSLFEYYSSHGFIPSRHKLYTALYLSKQKEAGSPKTAIAGSSGGATATTTSSLVETDAVISSCVECGRQFRTYVPDTICNLPNGSSVTYTDPQLSCPLCDTLGFGSFMNEDLFPELQTSATD